MQTLEQRMSRLYGEAVVHTLMPELERILKVHLAHKPAELLAAEQALDACNRFTEQDVILITYGDLIQGEESHPLETLARLLQCLPGMAEIINTVHMLPFFPYSSDRGFSIRDFRAVDPKLGSWQDIDVLNQRYQLMFDSDCQLSINKLP